MWAKTKRILKILFYPLLLVAGLVIGRSLTRSGSDDRQSDFDRAQGHLAAADESARRAEEQVDALAEGLATVRAETGRSSVQLSELVRRSQDCTSELGVLREQIDRAREQGADCTGLLEEYNRLSGRAVELIDELLRRDGERNQGTENPEHNLDNSDDSKRISGNHSAGT